MKYIVKKDIQIEIGNNCLFGNLHNLLKVYSYHLKEYELFILSDGLACKYLEKGKNTKEIHKNIVMNDYETILKNLSSEICVTDSIVKNEKTPDFMKKLMQTIQNDVPVIIIINSKCLDYQTPPPHLKEVEAFHAVIIYGFDDEAEKLFLYDSYVYDNLQKTTSYYQAEISFKAALENIYLYSYFECDEPKAINERYIFYKTKDVLRKFIKGNCGNKETSGIIVFESCVRDMEFLKDQKIEDSRKEFNELFYLFKIQFSFINEYLLKFFNDYTIIEKAAKEAMIKNIKIQIKDWNHFLMRMLIGSYLPDKKVIDKIMNSGFILLDKQKNLISDIVDVMDSIQEALVDI